MIILVETPLRVSFFGGGTDLPDYYKKYGGRVISTAIDKYTYALVTKRYDDKIYVGYSQQEIVDKVSDIKHDLVREAALITGMTRGFEVKTFADIPSSGSGLGSSSSITVGLLNAFHLYKNEVPSQEQLAMEACDIEINRLEQPIGKQDQYIAAYGGFRLIQFHKSGAVAVNSIHDLDEVERGLMMFSTGGSRRAEAILSRQVACMEDHISSYHEMKRLASNVNMNNFGESLNRSWELKKSLSDNITTTTVDNMIQLAKKAGAIGCKILGAGGGGFVLTYSEEKDKPAIRYALRAYRELPFKFNPCGSKVVYRRD